MMQRLTPDQIQTAARSLVTASESSLGIEVTTPVIYPNGQCVTVAVMMERGEYVVHDAGLGAMYLTAEGVRVSNALASRLASLAARYDCDFVESRISKRCTADDVAIAAMLVANASRSIGDHAAEIRRQSDNHFRYELSSKIKDVVGNRARENESFKGASGKSYRVANVILDRHQSHPIAFVVPLSSRNAVASQFRELFDLRAAFKSVANDSVYDESSDFRSDEDGWVLRQVGDVIPFGDVSKKISEQLAKAG